MDRIEIKLKTNSPAFHDNAIYIDEGCSKFVLWPIAPPDQLVSQVETFGQKIIPHFVS